MAQPTAEMIVRLLNLRYILFKDTEDEDDLLFPTVFLGISPGTNSVCSVWTTCPWHFAAPPSVQHAAAKVEFANLVSTPACCEFLTPPS